MNPEEKQLCYTIISGASSGLGREIAMQLAPSRKLVLHGRDPIRLEETRKLCSNTDSHILWIQDLSDPDKIEASLTDLLRSKKICVDCFVHSAGTFKMLPMRDMDPKSALAIMQINFLSAAEIVRQLLKKNVNQRQLRSVVFISSTASKFGAKALSLYCASKGALDSMMRALAVELAPNIRLNSILPGGVRTPMTNGLYSDPLVAARLEKAVPMGEGRAADVATAVEFLLSDKARWITGQQLVVDGGRTVDISA